MTAVLVVSCDGTWDEGRMPCRGALPLHRQMGDLAALRGAAIAAGWTLGDPAGDDRDLCPAHTLRAREGS